MTWWVGGVAILIVTASCPSVGGATDPASDGLRAVNGTDLYVKRIGTGEPVIIVHGGPMLDHGYFLPHLLPLADSFELIFYDQRLNGRSAATTAPESISLSTWVDDIDALRRELGFESVHLLGHSWGGLLAIHAAIQHPDAIRSLTLVSPIPPRSADWQEEELAVAARLTEADHTDRAALRDSEAFKRNDPSALADLLRLSFRPQFFDAERLSELNLYVPPDYEARGAQMGGMMGDLMTFDLSELLRGLRIPTLIVYGHDEPGADIGGVRLHDLVPDSRFARIPNAGHFPFVENPVAFLAVLRGFLAGDRGVGPVPPGVRAAFSLDPFYKKTRSALGLPIVASGSVADAAVNDAWEIVMHMTAFRPELLPTLAGRSVRLAVMGKDEMTTDIPEHADLVPPDFWDKRARGLGATDERPAVSCGEENLLGFPGDPYATENILIHEFSHAVHELAMTSLDATFGTRLGDAYASAIADEKWAGTYAATNVSEYWAEGAQSWFDTNRSDDALHNHVDTRDELKAYDPALSGLLEDVFGDGAWRYSRPETPPDAPRFEWSSRVTAGYDAFELAAAGQPLGEGSAWADLDPDTETPAASPESSRPTALLIVNATEGAIMLNWVDFHGESQSYGVVAAGGHRVLSTYLGHVWVLKDAADRERARVAASTDRDRIVVRDE